MEKEVSEEKFSYTFKNCNIIVNDIVLKKQDNFFMK